ncbi:unnamed protein product, partial [marine sediment metagenome]
CLEDAGEKLAIEPFSIDIHGLSCFYRHHNAHPDWSVW